MTLRLKVVLFTHPVCVGCGEAIGMLTRLEQEDPEVEAVFYSLAGQSGKDLAQKWGVMAVPTLVFAENPAWRLEGVPNPQVLAQAVEGARRGVWSLG
ncbi:MAG: thioredoxin family protein [Deltaproteobacteria bacterium]|nr:thioredoxin family protein [Deltaproteobacteria bacterium]